jgi:putative transposase
MAKGLVRYQQSAHLHFITFSCYQRRPYLRSKAGRELFKRALETMRTRYDFYVLGYVVMPEHVHILLTEPKHVLLSKAIQALKLSVSVQSVRHPFWLPRYYDLNVFTDRKLTEKLHYMHRNPVKRDLVETPHDWAWSSFHHYLTGERSTIEIESHWTVSRRDRTAANTQVSESRPGAPTPGAR